MMAKLVEQWGQPALISAIVALIVALVSRKLPFQQNLNDVQISTLDRLYNALLESHRLFINELNRLIFRYEEALNHPSLDENVKDQIAMEIRKDFTAPEVLRPAQEFMHSFVVPTAVRRAVAEYVVVTQSLVAVCMLKTKETGAQSAWDFALRRVEQPLMDVSISIRESLGIDELTAENRRAAGTLWSTRITRIKRWWRWKVHKERPASGYWTLMYHAQMGRLQDMATKFMGGDFDGDVPEYSELFTEQPRGEEIAVPADFAEPSRQMRYEHPTDGISESDGPPDVEGKNQP